MATMVHGWEGGLGRGKFCQERATAQVRPNRGLRPREEQQTVANILANQSPVASRSHRRRFGKKVAIAEFQTVKRIDNSRLIRPVDPAKMRSLYKTAILGGIVAVFFMLYIYQHFRCIDLSFQLEDLKAKQQQAAALNGQLRLEIATLRDPHRIDVIARHQLGLTEPTPTQVREYTSLDGAEVATARMVRRNRTP